MESIDSAILFLLLAAFFAGAIDAVVGGGGLIQIPALFAVYPAESAATLFGTNKCASVVGTANATWRYARQVKMPWRTILPAAVAAFIFSYAGAAAVAWLPKDAVRPLILILLIGAAIYTLRRKDFGQVHQPAHSGHKELIYAILLGGLIGFYDGFFGPGTGSFLIFLFVRFFGFDFLHASAGTGPGYSSGNLPREGTWDGQRRLRHGRNRRPDFRTGFRRLGHRSMELALGFLCQSPGWSSGDLSDQVFYSRPNLPAQHP